MARKKKSGTDFAARFAKLSEAVTTEAEKELFEIGVMVKDAAQQIAPVKTGTLKAGYAVRMRYRGTTPVAVVGTLVKYAHYVEFAEKIKGRPYGKNLRKPGRVIYAALDAKRNEIESRIADAVAKGLEKGAVESGL
jgi:hypothetical protein